MDLTLGIFLNRSQKPPGVSRWYFENIALGHEGLFLPRIVGEEDYISVIANSIFSTTNSVPKWYIILMAKIKLSVLTAKSFMMFYVTSHLELAQWSNF